MTAMSSAESTRVTSSDPAHPKRFEKKTNTALAVAPVALTALRLRLGLGAAIRSQ
jgi:hypothetical protein